MERATYTVDEAAELLGVGRDTVYRQIKRTNSVAGVPVLKVSGRKMIPAARLNAVLGIETQTDDESQAA